MLYRGMIACAALVCTTTVSPARAQGTMSGAFDTWSVHTPAKSGCPGIALQIRRDGAALKGFAETGDMAGTSRLSGTITADGKFTVQITQIDGNGPKGTITGSRNAEDGWLLADLKGSGCTDGPIRIALERRGKA